MRQMVTRLRPWAATIRRFSDEVAAADLAGAAAQAAFSLVLAVFPALIFLSALAGVVGDVVGVTNLFESILALLSRVMPPPALAAIMEPLRSMLSARSPELLSLGIIFTVWAASGGTAAMMRGFNRAHGVIETRPFWLHRIVIAVGVTVILGLLVVALFIVLVFGEVLAKVAVAALPVDPSSVDFWSLLVWPISALVLVLALDVFYWLGPAVRQRFRLFTLGSVLAAVAWLIFCYGFRVFITNFSNIPAVYGAIAGIIVLMLWFNYSALVVILGAKVNAFRAPQPATPAVPAPPSPPPQPAPPWTLPAPRSRGMGRYVAAAFALWTLAILVGALRRGGTSE